jgi:acylglycerol lipase
MSEARAHTMKEERIDGVSGLKIFVRSWRPQAIARGVVVIVPGFNSHSGPTHGRRGS